MSVSSRSSSADGGVVRPPSFSQSLALRSKPAAPSSTVATAAATRVVPGPAPGSTLVLMNNRRMYVETRLPYTYGIRYSLPKDEPPTANKASLLRELAKRQSLESQRAAEQRAASAPNAGRQQSIQQQHQHEQRRHAALGKSHAEHLMDAMARATTKESTALEQLSAHRLRVSSSAGHRNNKLLEHRKVTADVPTIAAVDENELLLIADAQQQQQQPVDLHVQLAAERRRHHALLERQRQVLLRQAQHVHMAQELHRMRASNAAIERQLLAADAGVAAFTGQQPVTVPAALPQSPPQHSLLPDFPEQPPLPLPFQAFAEQAAGAAPRREDGGVERIVKKRPAQFADPSEPVSPPPSAASGGAAAGRILLDHQERAVARTPRHMVMTAHLVATAPAESELSQIAPGGPGGSAVAKRAAVANPLPYRTNGASSASKFASSPAHSSPSVTPSHLKGGIFFAASTASKQQQHQRADAVVTTAADDDRSSSAVAVQQYRQHLQSQPSSQQQPTTVATVVTRKLDLTAAGAAATAAVPAASSDDAKHALDSPARRRVLALETREWIARRAIEDEEAHAVRALRDGKAMSLLGTFPSSSFSSLSSRSGTGQDSAAAAGRSASFASVVPPLLLYDMVLSLIERASWYEEQQQDHRVASSSNDPAASIAPLGGSACSDSAAALVPKPHMHRGNGRYHSSLWAEVRRKEEAAIAAARDRFQQKNRRSVFMAAHHQQSSLSIHDDSSASAMTVATRQQQAAASDEPSFAPYFLLPPKSVLGPLLQSTCASDIARRLCCMNAGQQVQQQQQQQHPHHQQTSTASFGAADTVTASFKRPTRAATASEHDARQLPLLGRAQMQTASAEMQAADDIVWHIADLIFARAAKKVVTAKVVSARY